MILYKNLNVDMRSDIYRLISFKFCVMIDSLNLYIKYHLKWPWFRGRVAQSMVCWARCPAWGSALLWASVEGIFHLEFTWFLTSFSKNSFGSECRPRSSLCAHGIPSHGLKRHSCPRQVTASNKNIPSMHHPWRRNVTTSMVGLKMVTCAKISPKMMNPRDIAGNTEEEEWPWPSFKVSFV